MPKKPKANPKSKPYMVNVRRRRLICAWDSFNPNELLDGSSRGANTVAIHLFGDRNVGRPERTNLQIATWLSVPEGDEHFIWVMLARTNVQTPNDEFHAFASTATVELNVGERPVFQMPLATALLHHHGDIRFPSLAKIPARQCYSVTIVADRRSLNRMLTTLPANIQPEPLIWIHLEGVALSEVDAQ